MMSIIETKSIKIDNNRLEVFFSYSKEHNIYFQSNRYWLESTVPIENVPESIAIIPFVTSILPIVWLTDSILKLRTLDKAFYESIENFKLGYVNMYPNLSFRGKVLVDDVEENIYNCENTVGSFFSGGVDAFATLFAHISENPQMITILGADIKSDDEVSEKNVIEHCQNTAETYGLKPPIFIKTNFREFLNQKNLDLLVSDSIDSWWYGIQHGIAIIGLSAILSYKNKWRTVYIASSFTANEIVPCASSPTIDEYVEFGSTKVHHDLYECSRQEKISSIVKMVNQTGKNISLRVCWLSRDGKNCSQCEKCLRTIYGLMAEGANPQMFGFSYTDRELKKSVFKLKRKVPYLLEHSRVFWYDIQKRFIEKSSFNNLSEWIKNYDFNRKENLVDRLYNKLL